MKSLLPLAAVAALALALLPDSAAAQAVVGSPAPQFTATDSHGQTHSLSEYRGKYVVLEWHNQGCPYTQKALRQRQHAGPAKGVDREGRGLVHGHLFGAGHSRAT